MESALRQLTLTERPLPKKERRPTETMAAIAVMVRSSSLPNSGTSQYERRQNLGQGGKAQIQIVASGSAGYFAVIAPIHPAAR
jgi:hypothetical protein